MVENAIRNKENQAILRQANQQSRGFTTDRFSQAIATATPAVASATVRSAENVKLNMGWTSLGQGMVVTNPLRATPQMSISTASLT